MNEQRNEAAGVAEFMEISKKAAAADLIRTLAELKDEGILTEDEFTAKKQELLARL